MKKRVINHLKTLKSRYTGFETIHHSLDNDDHIDSSVQPTSKARRRRRLEDGKPYGGGVGRVTKTMEYKLTECCGLAIRQSSESAKGIVIIFLIQKIRLYCRS